MLSYTPATSAHSKNDKAVNVSYEDIRLCLLLAAFRTIILHKYLIGQMLRVYYVDYIVFTGEREQWHISRRKGNASNCLTVCQRDGC